MSSIASSIVANGRSPVSVARVLVSGSVICSRSLLPANGATSRSTYLATMSHLEVDAASPARSSPRVVRSSVSGISETSKPSSSSAGDGQADAVDRDRALLDDVAQQLRPAARRRRRRAKPSSRRPATVADRRRRGPGRCGRRGGRVGAQRQLEVDRRAGLDARRARSARASGASTSAPKPPPLGRRSRSGRRR